jgi:hypothetical protein
MADRRQEQSKLTVANLRPIDQQFISQIDDLHHGNLLVARLDAGEPPQVSQNLVTATPAAASEACRDNPASAEQSP